MKYKRVLLKLSGEALMGKQQFGIDPMRLESYAHEIELAARQGVQIAIVIGGGNIFRGLQGVSQGMDRVQGDYMGMLATVINSMALQSTLKSKGLKAALLSGVQIDRIADSMSASKAIDLLESGHIVIISGGTGNPFFTTDTAAALRGVEIQAEVLLKGTRVDGVYTADPFKDKNAKKFKDLKYLDVLKKGLKVMDATAVSLCMDNRLPIVVFGLRKPGNIRRIIMGEKIGTVVN